MVAIKTGRRYRCIRTVYMGKNPDDIRYIEGKVYKSEYEGAITDETGEKKHYWFNPIKFHQTFIRVYNKRRKHGNSRAE